jgi:hypothetical protein
MLKEDDNYYACLAIVDRLDKIREEKGISYASVGKMLGFSPAYYNQIPVRAGIHISTLFNLARVLDVSIGYIITGKGDQTYVPLRVDVEKILGTKFRKGASNCVRVKRHRMRNGAPYDVSLKTLLDFSDAFKTDIMTLFTDAS